MKKLLLLLLVTVSATAIAQDYTFLTASTRRSKSHEFTEYLSSVPVKQHDSIFKNLKRYKDDGSTYTIAYADSIFKAHTKESSAYTTRSYRDTLTNQFYDVLHKRSDEELEEDAKYWKKYFKDDEENRKNLKGSTIDNLIMKDIQGNSYTSETLRGKVVIIDFWFITCAACIQEMPDLNKIREDFGTDEVAYFGVTYDKKEKVERFLEKVKYDYTIVADSKHLTDRFGIKFYPTTLVIDKKGKVQYTGEFMTSKDKPKDLRKLLKKLTSGKKQNITAGPLEKQD